MVDSWRNREMMLVVKEKIGVNLKMKKPLRTRNGRRDYYLIRYSFFEDFHINF